MRLYEVGGCVRDEILGIKSKDIDFTVVMEESDLRNSGVEDETDLFKRMVFNLRLAGFKIHVEHPEHLTVRAQFPKGHPSKVRDADFVLARKEGTYSDGRRPDEVMVGTLHDDLARRDFTMNAIAKDGSEFVDPFGGREDIERGVIRAVGDPMERITEDALRALRAVRFSITKGFTIEKSLFEVIDSAEIATLIVDNISDERIKDELDKMFAFDSLASIGILSNLYFLTEAIFSGSVSLTATMKTKGRNVPQPAPRVDKPARKCF